MRTYRNAHSTSVLAQTHCSDQILTAFLKAMQVAAQQPEPICRLNTARRRQAALEAAEFVTANLATPVTVTEPVRDHTSRREISSRWVSRCVWSLAQSLYQVSTSCGGQAGIAGRQALTTQQLAKSQQGGDSCNSRTLLPTTAPNSASDHRIRSPGAIESIEPNREAANLSQPAQSRRLPLANLRQP